MEARIAVVAYAAAAVPSIAWLLGLLASGYGGPLYALGLIPLSVIAVALLVRRAHAARSDEVGQPAAEDGAAAVTR